MKLSLPLIHRKKEDNREALLAHVLTEIQHGRATPEEMMARYPEHRGELEELLGLADKLYHLPEVKPSLLLRARVMALVREEGTARRRFNPFVTLIRPRRTPRATEGSNIGRLRSFAALRMTNAALRMTKMAAMAASLLMALVLAGAGTVYASWESLPGDPLYGVKTAAQEARLAVAFGEEDRAEVYLWMAESRLSELDRATQGGRLEAAQELAQGYQNSLALAIGEAQKDPPGRTKSGIRSRVEEHRAKHVEVLKGIYDRAPVEAQGAIALALEASQKASPSPGSGEGSSSRPAGSGQGPASEGGESQIAQGAPVPPASSGGAPSSRPAGSEQPPEREGQTASSPSGVGKLPTEKGVGQPEPTPVKGLPTPTPTTEPVRESPGREGTTAPPPGPVEGKVEGHEPVPPSQASPSQTERPTPTATPGQPRSQEAQPDLAGQDGEQKRARAESARGR